MSAAVALQYDSLFGMSSRPAYPSWPAVIDSNNGLLGQDLASYGSDISLSPPTGSRSIAASSPTTAGVTQREIRRQRDRARRDAKMASRKSMAVGELSESSVLSIDAVAGYSTTHPHERHSIDGSTVPSSRSSVSSISIQTPTLGGASSPASFMHSPPVSMADIASVSSATSMPVAYVTTSAPHISLISDPIATTTTSSLGPSYITSPAPYSPPVNQDVFAQPYQPYLPGYYSHMPPQHYQRPMIAEQPMLYPVSPPPPPSHPAPQHAPALGPLGQHPSHPQLPQHPQYPPHPPHPSVPGIDGRVRVLQPRPKAQCWEHGCNGRQFSTFSNLLRHQREKSGQATKAVCPNCGAEFTRTTARNGHLAHDKCKPRRSS